MTDSPQAPSMGLRWQRARYHLRDRIRNGSLIRKLMAYASLVLGVFSFGRLRLQALDRYLRWHPGAWPTRWAFAQVVKRVPSAVVSAEEQIIHHALVLKAPQADGERGYLLVSFENQLDKLVASAQFAALQERYDILFLPTWNPYYNKSLYRLVKTARRKPYLLPCSHADYELCRDTHDELISMPFYPSSWVDSSDSPDESVKDIDIVMITNYSPIKRHWLLFDALREMPRDLRVVLAGPPLDGRTADDMRREAKLFGGLEQVEICPAVPYFEGARLHARGRVCLALSAREGTYNAVAEAIMANTPVGIFANAVFGSRDYINEQTGVMFDPGKKLAPQLMDFLDRADQFTPAAWAQANISAAVNCAKLNALLRERSLQEGLPWTQDIKPFCSRRLDFFYDQQADHDAMTPAYAELKERYGFELLRPEPISRD